MWFCKKEIFFHAKISNEFLKKINNVNALNKKKSQLLKFTHLFFLKIDVFYNTVCIKKMLPFIQLC